MGMVSSWVMVVVVREARVASERRWEVSVLLRPTTACHCGALTRTLLSDCWLLDQIPAGSMGRQRGGKVAARIFEKYKAKTLGSRKLVMTQVLIRHVDITWSYQWLGICPPFSLSHLRCFLVLYLHGFSSWHCWIGDTTGGEGRVS